MEIYNLDFWVNFVFHLHALLGADIFYAHVSVRLRACFLHFHVLETILSRISNTTSPDHTGNDLRKIPSLFV